MRKLEGENEDVQATGVAAPLRRAKCSADSTAAIKKSRSTSVCMPSRLWLVIPGMHIKVKLSWMYGGVGTPDLRGASHRSVSS
jgi:hypothetical protein